MEHKLIMENWRGFIRRTELLENRDHIQFVLGVQVPLHESYTEYSQALVEEIIREQILFEGFWDSIKDKAKEYGEGIVNLFVAMKGIISRSIFLKPFSGELKTYLRNIERNFINMLSKLRDKAPALDKILVTLNDAILTVSMAVHRLKGWKYILAASGLIVVFAYVQRKFKKLFSASGLAQAELESHANDLYTYLIKTVSLEQIVSGITSKLTDIKSYLGFLGPLVGGVKFVGDALSDITGPFIEKWGELLAAKKGKLSAVAPGASAVAPASSTPDVSPAQ
jgi:hypothetical protein